VSGRPPRGLWPAVTDVERIAVARLRLYELYDQDSNLRDALLRFHAAWWNASGRLLRRLDDALPDLDDAERRFADLVDPETAHNYFSDLRALTAEVGLDRIPMVGTPAVVLVGYLPSGTGQAHRFLWHLDKALLYEAAPADAKKSALPVPRPTFTALASFGTPIPMIDDSIAGTNARWDPRTEVLADARQRLRAETGLADAAIKTELARIAEEGGYQFPDTSTQRGGIFRLDRDAQWVWWRIRRRWTYQAIAREWNQQHPDDFRLQARSPAGDLEARLWEARHPDDVGGLTSPAQAIALVRKAVTTFARRARVNIETGPGRRPRRG
jgi:hypothetical protein